MYYRYSNENTDFYFEQFAVIFFIPIKFPFL